MNIDGFIKWQAEKPNTRSVDIDIDKSGFRAWCYDIDLMAGQRVTDASQIDLEGAKTAKERAEFERLRAKFDA